MEKLTYKGFKVGQRARLLTAYNDYGSISLPGTEFEIISFPPVVFNMGNGLYFVHGKTDTGLSVRVHIKDIEKL